eukprot:GILK01012315.1.p1 GENE.GILK01012315.1~~GILK01012315.1.p1  ORF type:complete len:251 (-),score=19.98 GILK01012315.1:45-797(-)
MTLITSFRNAIVRHLKESRTDKKYRYEHKSVVVAGRELVAEISEICSPKLVLATEDAELPSSLLSCETYRAPRAIIDKICAQTNSDGIVAEFPMPQQAETLTGSHFLVIDRIADPGNLGSILRTATAFNWNGIFFLPETVDPFNDKVLRASRGALFKTKFTMTTWDAIQTFKTQRNLPAYTAHIKGKPISKVSCQTGCLLVLSHERTGPSSDAFEFGDFVNIPMSGKMESLNVSSAGSILLHHFRPAGST